MQPELSLRLEPATFNAPFQCSTDWAIQTADNILSKLKTCNIYYHVDRIHITYNKGWWLKPSLDCIFCEPQIIYNQCDTDIWMSKSMECLQKVMANVVLFYFLGGPLDTFLEAIWGSKRPLRSIWEVFWRPFGSLLRDSRGSLKRFGDILGALSPMMQPKNPKEDPQRPQKAAKKVPRDL